MRLKLLSICIKSLTIASFCSSVFARAPLPDSCDFISATALDGAASCMFMDRQHKSVMITPFRKVSAKKAKDWIIRASISLQLGGERQFESIVVATNPDYSGDSIELRSTETFDIRSDIEKSAAHIVLCKHKNDWSEVIGPDGKSESKPSCKPMK